MNIVPKLKKNIGSLEPKPIDETDEQAYRHPDKVIPVIRHNKGADRG